MERLPRICELDVEAINRTGPPEYPLSPSAPIQAYSNIYPAETPVELDIHEGVEVGVLLEGAKSHYYNDVSFRVEPGDVWLCPSWEPHGWRFTAQNSRDLVLMFLPEFLGEERLRDLPWLALFAVPPSQRPRVNGPRVREKVLRLGEEMVTELQEQQPGWDCALRLDLLRLLLVLSRDWRPPASLRAQSNLRARNLPAIMSALELVHSRPAQRVTVAQAAQSCGLSRAQFCLVFRNTMAMSFGRFCLHSRLRAAARLLTSSRLSIEAIAEQTGFTDGSHLQRTFAKHYGCTPGSYRSRPQSLQVGPPADDAAES
ncbi:MAG: helix-turn-helix domain-containing protein [Armatimonadota bacterium]|nr:MAG: helix-turn-helix domain-containing protein [Armatimonadota bacterium]